MSVASRMRQNRLARFLELVRRLPAPVRILDVGGTVTFWKDADLPEGCELTILNLVENFAPAGSRFRCVVGDARNLREFRDGEFDVCFSNSVIEHVGTLFDQIQMGREVQRVARAYFVQTPNRYFPIEPHFFFPGWQFLPPAVRVFLIRHRRFGFVERIEDPLLARAEVEQIRLLSRSEMARIFPDATIAPEHFGPFVKSWMAIRAALPR